MKKLISITVLSLGFLCGCGDRGDRVGTYPVGCNYIPTDTQIVAAYGDCCLQGVIVRDEEGNYYNVEFNNGIVTRLKFADYDKLESSENTRRRGRQH